jgi:hydrogenase expression/formation protein HypE
MSSDPPRPPAAGAAGCAVEVAPKDRVVLGHGSGGRLAHRLFEQILWPELGNPRLGQRDDAAVLALAGASAGGGGRLAFSTDSFVVTPLFFPGGDIGQLAVHGTINDLAMSGARPVALSLALILEEGLALDTLRRVVAQVARAAREAGVEVVTGDTKVVPRGKADGLFLNTSGIGVVPEGVTLSSDRVRPGDVVLVSGTLADHGVAVMAAREGLGLGSELCSDTAPLHGLVADLLASGAELRCLRDPTRGGVAAALTEIAGRSQVGFELDERALPLAPAVRAACELLGLDPLLVPSEGRCLVIASPSDAERVLAALRRHPLGAAAAVIGKATVAGGGAIAPLVLRTMIGGRRVVDLPESDPLPRIC